MGLATAFRAFWRALGDDAFSAKVDEIFKGERRGSPVATAPAALARPPAVTTTTAAPHKAARSDALTLLSVLQREGRLVDFLKEPITGYNDAQIGAAVRDIHRDCAAALDRIFALKPLLDQPDGSPVDVAAGFDAARYRLTGNVAGEAPYRGTLRHPGWVATQNQLPEWNGQTASANVIAPAEVEL